MPFSQFGGGKNVPFGHSEQRSHQSFGRAEEFNAGEDDVVQVILAAFFQCDDNVGAGSELIGINQRDVKAFAARFVNGDVRVGHMRGEVTVFLIEHLHAALVFVEFAGIVGFGEQVLKQNGVRNTDRVQVLHRSSDDQIAEDRVALDVDMAHLDLGAFIDLKSDFER